jgi:ribosome biogenesis protein Nip4
MAETIEDFAKLFGAKLSLDRALIVRKGDSFFLLSRNLKKLAWKGGGWLFVGLYLGKIKGGIFLPSFPLLSMIAEQAKNRSVVDDKAAWLFVCGRDIFREGVVEAYGSKNRGAYTLVFNRHGECLGFGKIIKDLDKAKSGVVVKNVLDVGDFLRRERTQILES